MLWFLAIVMGVGVVLGIFFGIGIASLVIRLLPIAMFIGGFALALYFGVLLKSNEWYEFLLLGGFGGLVVSLIFFPLTAVLNAQKRVEALEKVNAETGKRTNP
jgi:hypothetical protein